MESFSWSSSHGVLLMESFSWSPSRGVFPMESFSWSPSHGVLPMESYQRSPSHRSPSTEPSPGPIPRCIGVNKLAIRSLMASLISSPPGIYTKQNALFLPGLKLSTGPGSHSRSYSQGKYLGEGQ